jgi:NTE family protein
MLWDGITRRAAGLSGAEGTGGDAAPPDTTLSDMSPSDAPPATPPPIEPQPRQEQSPKLKIGIALGGGAARGWSHIGMLRVLESEGIVPDIVVGTSIGAVVGGCYAAGKLGEIEAFARSLTKRRVMGLLDFRLGASGLIAGERLKLLLEKDLGDRRIETLPTRFCTIATEIGTGHEIWLTRGPMVEAIRASYALPGIIDPVRIRNRLLMDGALVNPIPITAARALGADLVLCGNLNGDLKLRGTTIQSSATWEDDEVVDAVIDEPRRWGLFGPIWGTTDRVRGRNARERYGPGIAGIMIDAFNITQDRISRSRLAGDPPDMMIAPKLAAIGLFDFHRAAEVIALGEEATRRALPEIHELLAEARAQMTC